MPYITIAEFKNYPTGIDTADIIPGGTSVQNDAELTLLVERATAWVNGQLGVETLEARSDTDTLQTRLNRMGEIIVYPRTVPVISVSSAKYKISPNDSYVTIPTTYIQVYDRNFVVRSLSIVGVSSELNDRFPPLDYRTPYALDKLSRLPITLQFTYIAGYPKTTLSASSLVGATSLTLTSGTGVQVDDKMWIYDADKTEQVTVSAVSSNTITVGATTYAHSSGVQVSSVPMDIKMATILATAALIKTRGSLSITMSETSVQQVGRYKDLIDLDMARDLLRPYKRVVVS